MTLRYSRAFLFRAFVLLCLTCVAAIQARAQTATTPQFFFYTPGQTPTSYTQGLTSLTVTAGQTFTLSVYLQYQPTTSGTYYGIDAFVGFDQTNTSGTSATPQNNTVTFAAGQNENTAVTNVNPIFTDLLPNGLGGGQDPADQPTPSSALRPYGVDVFLGSTTGAGFGPTGSTPMRLFDIALHNANLGAGGSQNIVIYTNDPVSNATSFTTYIDNGSSDSTTFPRPLASTILNVIQGTAVVGPEPGTLALLSGPAALVGFCLTARRRRKSARH